MATSGNFLTSDSGQGGGVFYGRMIFEWWRTGWGRTGSVGYHNISYRLKSYGGSTSYWQNFYNGSMNVDGAGYSWGVTRVYGGGATKFGDYSKTLYTNSQGNRSFGASAQGGVYYNTINTSGSGSFALDNIPMYGDITAITGGTWNDEASSYAIDWYKRTGRATIWITFSSNRTGDTTYRFTNVQPDPLVWSGFQTWVQQQMVNHNSRTLYIHYGDDLDSNGSIDRWDTANTRTMTILNNNGQANPTFSDFDYLDTNSTTTTVTGDDQVLIQGKSTLRVTVPYTDRALPNKNANMVNYVMSIGSKSSNATYVSSTDLNKDLGTVDDVTGLQGLSVKAVDSRGNNKTVEKTVEVLPYTSPAFIPTFNVRYSNDFDTSNGITVEADSTKIAEVSPLTLSGTDKNTVNGTSGVRFDVKKGTGSYTGTWVNVATSFGTNTGDITTTIATLESAILSKINGLTADNTVEWFVKFEITDALETVTKEIKIGVGKPIFRIGTDGNVYNNEERIPTINQLDTLYIYYNNGTGTRSTTTSGTYADIPGATGDTSYTAPCDVSIVFTTTHMTDRTAGIGYFTLAINGTPLDPAQYLDSGALGTYWSVDSITHIVDVDEGDTIDIDSQWRTSSGTLTVTNDSNDDAFPNQIVGIVIPRN